MTQTSIVTENNGIGQMMLKPDMLKIVDDASPSSSLVVAISKKLKTQAKTVDKKLILGWQIVLTGPPQAASSSSTGASFSQPSAMKTARNSIIGSRGLSSANNPSKAYVITGMSHVKMQGTLYRLSRLDEHDRWLKLKLTEESNGFPFLLLRKVLHFSD
jgi:hypothetical protein